MFHGKPAAGATEAGLDLVDDEEGSPIATQLRSRLQKVGTPDVDAAFTLDDFQDDGRR